MKTCVKTLCGLALTCALGAWAEGGSVKASSEYADFYDGDTTKGVDFVQSIRVLSPSYCSSIRGNTVIVFEARGMKRVIARLWQQPTAAGDGDFGKDTVLGDVVPDAESRGDIAFNADDYPNGPLTIRLQALDDKGHQDYCELQVYNLGGVKWKQGIPKEDPVGARGLKLVFEDDFDGPLSISPDGMGARYAAHKTGGGDFSGYPFSDPYGPDLPFGQKGTFLRIHASKPKHYNRGKGVTGILSSIRADGSGISVPVPFYMECRYVCQSAPGTWSAFWTLTKNTIGMDRSDPKFAETEALGCDELDVIESYGGFGPRNPNSGGLYACTTHFWAQDDTRPDWSRETLNGKPNPGYVPTHRTHNCADAGSGAWWSWTFHTYGLRADEKDIVYYCDGKEVLRHPTNPSTLKMNTWFLINYAIGGISGWQIDLKRYGNQSDMWVDYVRVYCGKDLGPDFGRIPLAKAEPTPKTDGSR